MGKHSSRPMHDKLVACEAQRAAVADFIDWLHAEGLTICDLRTFGQSPFDYSRYLPTGRSVSSLIAGFLDIDENALEREKRTLLAELRTKSSVPS